MSLSKKKHLRRETNCATIFGNGKARSAVLMSRCTENSDAWTYEVRIYSIFKRPRYQNEEFQKL